MKAENLSVFQFEGSNVRVLGTPDEPLFVASDVCNVLEHSNSRKAVADLVHEDDVTTGYVTDALGRKQQTNLITESGLYALIFGSRKQEAKRFKKWITSEVLPSIRKHGGYLTPEKIEEVLLNPDTLIRLATDLKTERERRLQLESTVSEQQPKVEALDRIATANGSLCISDAAKSLQVPPRKLFDWLSVQRWIYRRAGCKEWIAYQERIQQGVLEHKVSTLSRESEERVFQQVRIMPKGLALLAKALGTVGVQKSFPLGI